MTLKRNRERDIGGDIQEEFSDLFAKGYGGKEIHEGLKDKFEGRPDLPSLRTTYRMVKERTPPDTSGVWTLGGSDGEDEAYILRALAELIRFTHGRRRTITKEMAKWIGRVHNVAPTLSLRGVWVIAEEYMVRHNMQQSASDLDQYLAMRAWETEEKNDAYKSSVDEGRIDSPERGLRNVPELLWRLNRLMEKSGEDDWR